MISYMIATMLGRKKSFLFKTNICKNAVSRNGIEFNSEKMLVQNFRFL